MLVLNLLGAGGVLMARCAWLEGDIKEGVEREREDTFY